MRKALLISDKQSLSLMINKSEFTKLQVQVIVGNNEIKEEEKMFHNVTRKVNIMMCCRMLNSRTYDLAGAFGCPFAYLNMRQS